MDGACVKEKNKKSTALALSTAKPSFKIGQANGGSPTLDMDEIEIIFQPLDADAVRDKYNSFEWYKNWTNGTKKSNNLSMAKFLITVHHNFNCHSKMHKCKLSRPWLLSSVAYIMPGCIYSKQIDSWFCLVLLFIDYWKALTSCKIYLDLPAPPKFVRRDEETFWRGRATMGGTGHI